MSQDWVADLYTVATVGNTTLSNMELMFATLKSTFSGTSPPSSQVLGQVWYDSNTSYKCLQVRNYGNTAWRGVMAGSSALKIWMYLNAVEEGWTIDSSVTDRVLALKGGSTYTTGGAPAGTWTISGISTDNTAESGHSHNHDHDLENAGGYANDLMDNDVIMKGSSSQLRAKGTQAGGSYYYAASWNTDSDATASSGHTHSHSHTQNGLWRISAAVGIMGRPNARG